MNSALKNWITAIQLRWFLLGACVYSLLVMGLIYGFIMPYRRQYDQTVTRQASIDETYINLVSLDLETALDSTRLQIERLSAVRDQFTVRLTPAPEFNSLIPRIDQYCQESGLDVLRVEPLPRDEVWNKTYTRRFIKLAVSGSLPAFQTFLKILESHPTWVLVDKLAVVPGQGTEHRFDLVLYIVQKGKT